MRRVRVAVLASMVLAGAACGNGDGAEPDAGPEGADVRGTVLVFAAASLTDSFTTMAAAFEDDHPDAEVELNLAGSSALREQILAGAPADVLAVADASIMDEVAAGGAVRGDPTVFARNRMQIAVPAGNPGGVTSLDDFAEADLLIGLCASGVPCGDLGRRVLAEAGVDPAVDTNEPDVRALRTKIAVAELDAGLVYASDVVGAGGDLEGIDVPAGVDAHADYPIAVLVDAPHPSGAAAFVDHVRSAEGQLILRAAVFAPP